MTPSPAGSARRLGLLGLLGFIAAWLAAGVVGALVGRIATGATDDAYATPGTLLGHVGLPSAFGLVITVGAIGWLRWWPPVWREPLRLRRWGWAFPAAMVVSAAVFADWSRLASAGAALVVALVVTVLLIAASEELAFRGVALLALRERYQELVAALLATLLFSVLHMIVAGGLANLGQGISTFLGGWLYYLTRRVSGGILVPIVVHAWWDLTAFSALVGPGIDSDTHVFESLVVLLVACLVALASWRLLRPASPPTVGVTAAARAGS